MSRGWTRVSTLVEFRRSANTETYGKHHPMVPAPQNSQVTKGVTDSALHITLAAVRLFLADNGEKMRDQGLEIFVSYYFSFALN